MANHTYYLLLITCHLALSFSPHKGDRGTRGQGDKYILSPPPLEKEYIYLPIIILVIQSYKDFMFMRRELMFTDLEYMFTDLELMFIARKHNFSR